MIWRSHFEGSIGYHARFRVRRIEIGWHVYRHTYPTSSDRWVLQPFAIYDRQRQ